MERVIFSRKNLNGQRPRDDRFVAPRAIFPELRRRMSWVASYEHTTVDIWYQEYMKRKRYIAYLDHALGLEPFKFDYVGDSCKKEIVEGWPCIPRKRGCLSSADSILDLPSYKYAPCDVMAPLLCVNKKTVPELLDWSSDNILVAALGNKYHKWSWQTQSLISPGTTKQDIRCCKFDPRGELLLLGTDMKNVEIHNNVLNKLLRVSRCVCFNVGFQCSITALDWSPTGNAFIAGCSRGTMTSLDRDANVIHTRHATSAPIITLRVSPDARFVAAAALNTSQVTVFTWPFLKSISTLESDWTVKTLAWHPWRSALLGVGAVTSGLQTRIALWDAAPRRVREVPLGSNQHSLDVMLFSQNTGELVLSLCSTDPEATYQNSCSQIVVMSDPDTVVDQWGEGRTGLDRVRTMVFSPDGVKLATATADEDLVIWNFLPEDIGKKRRRKNFSALPAYLDEVTYGQAMR